MNKLFKTLAKCKLSLLALAVALIVGSCTKDNNPFDLKDADKSQYGGNSNDGVIKILAIGNSFSEDALEANLYELAKEKGKTVIIGNMYIGGASLAEHKKNTDNKASVYNYRKIGKDGVKRIYNAIRMDMAIEDEHWDYISFQQVSQNSGQLETVQASLPAVYNYVKSKVTNPNVKYVYHQTWAYAQSSTHEGFANYGNNQTTMYNAIVNVSQKAKDIVPINIIVPAGTAIQNGRTSAMEDGFTRDGYHLNDLGKYTAACTWFETLFGQSAVGLQYKPAGMGNFEAAVAQNAAHRAVLKPFEITAMPDFLGEPGPLTAPVQIDFGDLTASPNWNQVRTVTAGTRINLKDSQGKEYGGLALTITERFNAINTDGPAVTNTPFNMPENVSRRSFFGNSKAAFNSIIVAQSTFVLSGLDQSRTYNICFFGARGGVSDNRETKFTAIGTNQAEANLNTSSNTANTVCVNAIKPDTNGKITVKVTSGANNNNGSGFYYLTSAVLTSN
ncbi:DUF4886 domain-containing protein [Pedobacter sp. UBA4863]|uniref:DUF4886 domain-containing protein n=1 Tax=Pedobacter sp. UBA4863 TaxID=1947060 RepID=UPI0025E5AAA7|nr:DUF4886 domain-containing protein [Pedobacter sp. UBA4863]